MASSMDAEPRRYAPPVAAPSAVPAPAPAARPALPPEERRRLRITGAIAGALIAAGAGAALPITGMLLLRVVLLWMGVDLFGDDPFVWLMVGIGSLGALLVLAGWLVSLRLLRHWGSRGQRLTLVAAAISFAAAVLADVVLVVLLLALDGSGEFPGSWLMVGFGGAAALPVGALVGLCAWPWVAHLLRPAHPPLTT
ncbi:hypothetical protein [Agrococcus beijingensis]|uniref:hypothetical protein n=1 Tax=Agrococcus beijingensis TaxID=3068634 RepID=UPI002740ABE4|nr:hypothetical protein [Agrococcus sp. REN33]